MKRDGDRGGMAARDALLFSNVATRSGDIMISPAWSRIGRIDGEQPGIALLSSAQPEAAFKQVHSGIRSQGLKDEIKHEVGQVPEVFLEGLV